MKKHSKHKLSVKTETIRSLSGYHLQQVDGGVIALLPTQATHARTCCNDPTL